MRIPGFSRKVDLEAVEAFLAFNFVPTPLSIFREARKLPAGHLLIAEEGSTTVREYARLQPVPAEDVRGESAPELEPSCASAWPARCAPTWSPTSQWASCCPGGLDSGALTALASEVADEPVNTFTIGFEEECFSELPEAKLVAERFGTKHPSWS